MFQFLHITVLTDKTNSRIAKRCSSEKILHYFVHSKGRSFYRLSETSPIAHPGLQCSSWIASDVSNTANPVVTSEVTKCPPSLLQRTDSLVQFTDAGIPNATMTCYADRSAMSSTSGDPRTKRCCYDNTNNGLILDHVLTNGFNTYRYAVQDKV